MRVGIYVDGFNVYYGGRAVVGRGVAGWRWLDYRALSQQLIARRRSWSAQGATVHRIVYCTAFIDGATNPNGRREQDTYVRALRSHQAIDVLEEGSYVSRVKTAPLATRGQRGRPVIARSAWPVMVKDSTGVDVNDAMFMVSSRHWEEKGSDVNVASRLLIDVLDGEVDAAGTGRHRQPGPITSCWRPERERWRWGRRSLVVHDDIDGLHELADAGIDSRCSETNRVVTLICVDRPGLLRYPLYQPTRPFMGRVFSFSGRLQGCYCFAV